MFELPDEMTTTETTLRHQLRNTERARDSLAAENALLKARFAEVCGENFDLRKARIDAELERREAHFISALKANWLREQA